MSVRSALFVSAFLVAGAMVGACSSGTTNRALPFSPALQTDAARPNANLLVNGNAELGDATLTGYDSVTIPGWSQSGLPTVVPYGIKGFPRDGRSQSDDKQFFTGGPFSSSTLTQTADVSAAAGPIDRGGVRVTLSGRLGGKRNSRDDARVTAIFLNASGSQIGGVAIGPVTMSDRDNRTALLGRSKTVRLVPRTRAIRTTAQFTMYGKFISGVSLDNAYADDLNLVLSTPIPAPTMPPPSPPKVPAFDHVFFVYFENSNYDQIIGNTLEAPYINSVAKQFALLTNYYALHHPSDANYVLQAAGGTYGLHRNDFAGHIIYANHLADLVENAGGSWKQYMQSTNGPCDQTVHGYYYPDDGPYMYFADVRNRTDRCRAHVVPLTAFAKDLASIATTPQYAWLSPDDCSDMEGCGIAAGDSFLRDQIMKPLIASPAWRRQNTLLVVSWDEDDFTPVNHIAGIFISRNHVKEGYRANRLYTHYSILKTIEAALGVPTLSKNDRYAALVNDVWR